MFQIIIQTLIKDYSNTQSHKVRERYGIVCSVLSIICNTFMVIFKLIFGYMIHSVALLADGFNNLSDVGSNIATLFGFKLASKHPDNEHPYGHGRYEYIAGLIISFLILLVGFSSLQEAVMKIIEPSPVLFQWSAVIVIIVSIIIKLWMFYFNNKAGKLIDSPSLKAAGQDSLNDVFTTLATLISIFLGLLTDFPIDGLIGAVVSLFVLKSGVEIFRETVDPLLGKAPDKKLIDDIYSFVMGHQTIMGIHDFMIHDYGPGRKYMTFHAEIDCHEDIMEVHDQIDKIERELLQKFNILTTIHMDPVDTKDERTKLLKIKVNDIVCQINDSYSIHDFRVIYGKSQSKLIFDVLIPSTDTTKHSLIRKEIEAKVKELNSSYSCIIQVEHSYI